MIDVSSCNLRKDKSVRIPVGFRIAALVVNFFSEYYSNKRWRGALVIG